MADEEDPGAIDDAGDTNVVEASVAVSSKAATPKTISAPVSAVDGTPKGSATPKGEAATDEELVEIASLSPPPPEDDGYRKPVQLYRHWVRPKFLQYKYMYNYRTNYYDDVIDYLDKKQIGVLREIPRPQTWAERVLRTNYANGRYLDHHVSGYKQEKQLMQTLAATIRPHNYHTKAYINQKYAKVL